MIKARTKRNFVRGTILVGAFQKRITKKRAVGAVTMVGQTANRGKKAVESAILS